ncbi:phytosulfokine receptor 2-like [Rutidosis leptorrhynchoides]|uniref:phytosulfokine receptor 2-like n=1 Tax=Rutidosis leptorrhynchoides TaxID=125765 RepID=UPI003A9A5B61
MSYLSWVLFVFLLCSYLGIETLGQICNPDDLLALKEFAASFSNGSVHTSWSSDGNCCNWDGVVCENDAKNVSKVIILSLSSKGLKGVISNSISRLVNLRSIDLSFNQLEGELPKNLSNLKNLEVLNVSSNSLIGDLLGIGGFPNLIAFNLSNNSFSGEFNSQICSKNLKFLDLSKNHFTGNLEGFRNCNKSLEELHVDSNSFSGDFPEFIYSISSLKRLSVSSNNFSGQISANLSMLFNLELLVLYGNRFVGPFPNVFENLTHLEQLNVHSNSFTGELPSTLEACSRLKLLDLRNNSFSGALSIDFSKFTNLCTLDLGSNRFNGLLPNSLSNCHELRILNLAKNELYGEVPISYMNLSNLSFLSFSSNGITNIPHTLSVLQHCKNLTTLILTKNFHGERLPVMSGFQFDRLMVLAIANCALKGQIPNWLLGCPKLEVLDLSWNRLDGVIPSWIGQMDRLFYLDFSNNSLTGQLPENLTELKSLVSLNVSSTILGLTTGIPLYVKRNQSVKGLQYNQVASFPPSIYLSHNKINGTILPYIGKLKNLHVLDLSKNNLSGTIPTTISEMGNLEVLDLSSNDLNGSIPESLNKLTFLSMFCVANNHLEGPIPIGTQFSGFPSSSFEGNPGLCGESLSPCSVKMGPSIQPNRKLGRGSIFGITLGLGAVIAILLAIVFVKMSRRKHQELIVDVEDDTVNGSLNGLSGVFNASKLVLFPTSGCRDLTVSDVVESTNNFSQANIIGCGGFGLVYKADLPNGSKAAIKRLSGDCGQMDREFHAEVEALSRAQHKNLVSLKGYCKYGNDRLLIYSYMENGSLDYWLHERVDEEPPLKWRARLKIAKGAAQGLAYLHNESKIIHRDIKTSNILLDERFKAHLADFGLSRLLCPYDTHVTTDLVGTLGYIPPEYGQTLSATFKGDVYSFGVVLLELITARRPVEVAKGKNCRDLVSWVFQMKLESRYGEIFDILIWDKSCETQMLEVLGIACKCLDQDPRRRPSIEQVVLWLDEVAELGHNHSHSRSR